MKKATLTQVLEGAERARTRVAAWPEWKQELSSDRSRVEVVRWATCLAIARDRYATVITIGALLGAAPGTLGALALPMRTMEEAGEVVRFRLPNGLTAWGLAPW